MLINEVVKKTGVAKKTLYYYEQEGLITPEVLENNYRNFTQKDILDINKIILLRALDMSIHDIRIYLSQPEQQLMLLQKYECQMQEEEDKLSYKKNLCQRLRQNDIKDYINELGSGMMKKKIIYPVRVWEGNSRKEILQRWGVVSIFCAIFFFFGVFSISTFFPIDISIILIISVLIISGILLLPMAIQQSLILTEKDIQFYEDNYTGFVVLTKTIEYLIKNNSDKDTNHIPYDEVIDVEIRWKKLAHIDHWTVLRIYLDIHLKHQEPITLELTSMNGTHQIPDILHVFAEKGIPIFDHYRMMEAVESGIPLYKHLGDIVNNS